MNDILKSILTVTFTALFAFTFSMETEAQQGMQQNTQPDGDTVIEVVNSSSESSEFAEILAESDIEEVLTSPGPFTVLAPSDEALEEEGLTADELRDNPEQLQEVIRPHLYQGNMTSDRVESALNVEVKEGDKEAANGVVHIVDEVVTRE